MSFSLLRRSSPRKRRKSTLLGSILTTFIILTVYYSHSWPAYSISSPEGQTSALPKTPLLEDQAHFWRSLFQIILNNNPRCNKKPDVVIPTKLDIGFEDTHIHNRPDILWVDDADIQRLKVAHQNFLSDVRTSKIKLVYHKGSRGIVTTASDTQIPVLLVQLRMVRASGSLLPVEVFLSQPSPYTDHVCRNILPSLTATCAYYSHIFTAAGTGVDVTSYQYKILAILFSSFDEFLLLDSDAWPISNPDHLFIYPPFTNTGLILWPDFWYASESPYFFSIAKIENPPPLHIKPSIESGELMYSKSKHETSILLAAYYNYYGPQYYYPLLSQGAPGEGDKETFGSAAMALKEEFYWVKTMVGAIGRVDSSGHFLGSAMIQYDPIVDIQNPDATPRLDITAVEDHDEVSHQQKNARIKKIGASKRFNKPMFIHANFPKFDPRTIFDNRDMGNGVRTSPARDTNGTYVRCWDFNAQTAMEKFGYDVERRFWEVIKTVACDDLVGEGDMSRKAKEIETCSKVETYIQQVFEGSGGGGGAAQSQGSLDN